MTLTVGSMFSGVGGLDRGFTAPAYEHLFLCESDSDCRAVLRRHFPDVPIYEDVRTFDPEPWRGRVDVVLGGVPCQDWSMAGRRRGLAGPRSGLFFDFARQVDAVAPRWVIFENVFGLLSACSCCEGKLREGHSGRDFAIVLAELTGFHPAPPVGGWRNGGFCAGHKGGAAWRVLDARWSGVAQRRRRVFVVVERARTGAGAVQVLLESDSGRRDSPPSREPAPCAADAVGDGPGGGPMTEPVAISENQRGEVLVTDYVRSISTGGGKPGAGYPAVTDGVTVRRLTPTERERLMGWPDGWTAWGIDEDGQRVDMTDTARNRMTGNGVVSTIAAWLADRLATETKQ